MPAVFRMFRSNYSDALLCRRSLSTLVTRLIVSRQGSEAVKLQATPPCLLYFTFSEWVSDVCVQQLTAGSLPGWLSFYEAVCLSCNAATAQLCVSAAGNFCERIHPVVVVVAVVRLPLLAVVSNCYCWCCCRLTSQPCNYTGSISWNFNFVSFRCLLSSNDCWLSACRSTNSLSDWLTDWLTDCCSQFVATAAVVVACRVFFVFALRVKKSKI